MYSDSKRPKFYDSRHDESVNNGVLDLKFDAHLIGSQAPTVPITDEQLQRRIRILEFNERWIISTTGESFTKDVLDPPGFIVSSRLGEGQIPSSSEEMFCTFENMYPNTIVSLHFSSPTEESQISPRLTENLPDLKSLEKSHPTK